MNDDQTKEVKAAVNERLRELEASRDEERSARHAAEARSAVWKYGAGAVVALASVVGVVYGVIGATEAKAQHAADVAVSVKTAPLEERLKALEAKQAETAEEVKVVKEDVKYSIKQTGRLLERFGVSPPQRDGGN